MVKLLTNIPAFPVRHMAKSVKFYTGKMGFICPYKEDGFAIMKRDKVELHLWKSSDYSW